MMNKEPQNFKTISFPGANGQPAVTALEMTLSLGQKSFEIAQDREDELWAMTVVSLFNSLLENLQGISFEFVQGIV